MFAVAALLTAVSFIERQLATIQLHTAIAKDDIAAVRQSLSVGANVDQRHSMRSAVEYAALRGNSGVFDQVFKRSVARFDPDALGQLTTYAALMDRTEILDRLIAHGANVNWKNMRRSGKTPLMAAAENGQARAVVWLVDNGADVNAVDEYGESALMKATARSDEPVVKVLLAKGADVDIRSKSGKTAVSIAKEIRNTVILNLLLKRDMESRSVGRKAMLYALPYRTTPLTSSLLR